MPNFTYICAVIFKTNIMKFIVSSTDLLQGLLSIQRVIASKNSLPVLDNFMFDLKGNSLTVTASDSETTLKAVIILDEVIKEGEIAVPAKLLTDTLRELPTQPIEFSADYDRNIVDIVWSKGNAQIPFVGVNDYPELPQLSDPTTLHLKGAVLADGINNTLYATGDEELRPVMNGIFFDISTDSTTLVASNAHKLVYYRREDIKGSENTSFILPKKPAYLLKGNLAKYMDEDVEVSFDKKNAYFKFSTLLVVCRLVEGTYPAYKTVIPQNNTNVVTINRHDILNVVKRVAVCANQATSLIAFKLTQNLLEVSAQDLDFSTSAHESIECEYEGTTMEIGFKSTFLIEILSNLPYDQICIKLADPNRAALIQPTAQEDTNEEICALLMPMRINF